MFHQSLYRPVSHHAPFTGMVESIARVHKQCSEMQRRVNRYREG